LLVLRRLRWCSSGLLLIGFVSGSVAWAQPLVVERNQRLALPESRLHREYEGPVFITGHIGLGGAFQYKHGQIDYGASFIFRPASAANFLDILQKTNSGMVLRLDYQSLSPSKRLFSGDFLIRHYFGDRGQGNSEVLPFMGLGIGATDARLPSPSPVGSARYWSWLAEVGQEWYFRPQLVLVMRAQYRYFSYGRAFVTAWAVSAAVGVPVPW